MKKALITLALLVVVICSLCGCTNKITILEFTFSNSKCEEEKPLYFNDDYKSVTLNANIEIDTGTASIRIVNKESNRIVWEKTTDKTEAFDIELTDVAANSEYVFSINSEQIKYLHLKVTSAEKLIRDKEKLTK